MDIDFAILRIVGVVFMVIIGIVVMIVLPAINQGMDAPYPTALLGTVYLFLVPYAFSRFFTCCNSVLE